MRNRIIVPFITAAIILISSAVAFANKTSVTIDAPQKVKRGTEITITLNVKHIGNTIYHFTDWVVLKINDIQVKKWSFTKSALPTAENFSLTFKIVASQDLIIQAQGNCNLHGSTGLASANVKIFD